MNSISNNTQNNFKITKKINESFSEFSSFEEKNENKDFIIFSSKKEENNILSVKSLRENKKKIKKSYLIFNIYV